eukprot:5511424-Ditylum_brightwellii.AAC.1
MDDDDGSLHSLISCDMDNDSDMDDDSDDNDSVPSLEMDDDDSFNSKMDDDNSFPPLLYHIFMVILMMNGIQTMILNQKNQKMKNYAP